MPLGRLIGVFRGASRILVRMQCSSDICTGLLSFLRKSRGTGLLFLNMVGDRGRTPPTDDVVAQSLITNRRIQVILIKLFEIVSFYLNAKR